MDSSVFAAALARLPVQSEEEIKEEKHIGIKGEYIPKGKLATAGMIKLLGYRLKKKGWKVRQQVEGA
jgi:hypothetical protein